MSSIVEGDGDDVKHQLQKIEEIESLEAKLFQEIEASTQRSNGKSNVTSSGIKSSSGKKDSQAKKIRAAPTGSSSSSTSVKIAQPTRSSSSCGGSVGNKVKSKSPARSASSKTVKPRPDSPSKRSGGVTPKNKVGTTTTTTRMSRTPPASPVSSGSSSSKFSDNQRSKRGSSVPRRSTVSNEKPAAIDVRKNDEWKTSKPVVRLIPKTQSSISLKVKPPPVVSHPSPVLFNSSTSSTDQKSKAVGNKDPTVRNRSKSTLKNHPIGQTPDRNEKQSAASRPGTRSPSASKTRKLSSPKTVAAVNTGLKPMSQKTNTPKSSRKQSSAKAKSPGSVARGVENIVLVSPEVMDIKGKLNALKMEISMQKKDRCKEIKTNHNKSGKGESSSMIKMNNKTRRK